MKGGQSGPPRGSGNGRVVTPGHGHPDVEMLALDWGKHSKKSHNTRLKSNKVYLAAYLA